MDVVNGKIVSARMERTSAEAWNGALQPSRGLTAEGMHEHMRGNEREWAGSLATPSTFSDENPLNAWGGPGAAPSLDPPYSLALEPGAARWSQRPASEKHHFGALQPRPVAEHRQGWGGHHRHHHFGPQPQPAWSEKNLDQMMAMYESQIVRPVPSSVANACATSSLGEDQSPTPSLPLETSKECSLQRLASDAGSKQESEAQPIPKPTLVRTSSNIKRKRLERIGSEEADQADCGWSHPLKVLLRKGLSVSDVGELGRIIIPKRYAESQFQQIDTKEGTLLEMEDYTLLKRWFFRFKWWINNKSRMYVLENTGEFIKYHSLKEHDIFVIYEDSSRKLVVRGHKGTDLDSALDVLEGTNAGRSAEKASSTKEEELASTTALAGGILQNLS